jgi:hypothetical protein
LVVELEHLKTKTRLIDKKFTSVRGNECRCVYYHELVYYVSKNREGKRKPTEFIIKSIEREPQTRPIYDCRYDERLEPKDD